MGESESQPDILVDINYMDLGFISSIYRNHEQLCYASYCAANGFKILHLRLRCNINFLSPCELWKENGTFFVVVEFDTFYEIGIFAPYISNINNIHDAIYSGLCYAKKINIAKLIKPIVFKTIHESLHYLIMTYITSHDLEIDRDERFYISKLQREAALKFYIRVPKEVEMRPLRRENWYRILLSWPYDHKPPPDYITTMIKVNGGYGIFSKVTGDLLSWGLKTMMGTIEFVQTLPRARRKKYATTIIKMLAVELAKENQHPVATIKIENAAAYSFFEHLGFRNVGVSHDIYLKSKTATDKKETSRTISEYLRGKTARFCGPGPSQCCPKSFAPKKEFPRSLAEYLRLKTARVCDPSSSQCCPSSSAINNLPLPFKRSSQRNSISEIYKMKNFNLNLLADTLEGGSSKPEPPRNEDPLETLRGMTTSPTSSSSTGTSEDPSTIDSELEIEENDEFLSTEEQEENTRKMSVSNTLISNEYRSVSNVNIAGSNEQLPSTSNEHSLISNEDSNEHPSVSRDLEMANEQNRPSTISRPITPTSVLDSSGTISDNS
ncbi:uncharacterized protein [Diabrotica undecimpunctata]|uniref:uncharacterized protein n=1 Tax=Diabrotica undecimpunctata TaxID=50387 RepID=UPI003B63380D